MNKFVMIWNSGLFCKGNKNVFNRDELNEIFSNDFGLKELMMNEGEVYSVNEGIDEMIECGNMGESVELINEECVEMGDDFVNVSIVRIDMGKGY